MKKADSFNNEPFPGSTCRQVQRSLQRSSWFIRLEGQAFKYADTTGVSVCRGVRGGGGPEGLLLGLFASHLVDLGGSVQVSDGGGQLDVLPAVGSSITCTQTHMITSNANIAIC